MPPPMYTQPTGKLTLGSLIASIEKWGREAFSPADRDICADAIHDTIVDLWESIVLFSVGDYIGGQASATFAPSSDVCVLTSVTDPVAPLALTYNAIAGPFTAFSIQYTYVTDSGSETAGSPAQQINSSNGTPLQIAPPAAVALAYGWNLYINGVKQNDEPIQFTGPMSNWTQPDAGVAVNGPPVPTQNTTGDNVWYIKDLSAALATGGEKHWEETEIGSTLWDRYSRGVARSDPGQAYCYDFISGNTIKLRPVPQANTPFKYFFVLKPVRVVYENAVIPFTQPSAERYIRYASLALVKLTQDEYNSSQRWAQMADAAKKSMLQAILGRNIRKNDRVTPFMR